MARVHGDRRWLQVFGKGNVLHHLYSGNVRVGKMSGMFWAGSVREENVRMPKPSLLLVRICPHFA